MVTSNSIKGVSQYFKRKLSGFYEDREIDLFFELSCEAKFQYSKSDIILDGAKFSESEILWFRSVLNRLKENEPIQYILEQAHFYGHNFYVNKDVLIPRPETEELVDVIIKDNPQGKLLDIGTGSGIIPISLKKALPKLDVHAIDISKKALEVAKKNAEELFVDIQLICSDILKDDLLDSPRYDVIVSNPPYVLVSDKKGMSKNVLDYEPELALFVKDSEPLVFYNRICELSKSALKDSGILYFEIHEDFGIEVKQMMEKYAFKNIVIIQDLQGKNRIVKGVK